MCDHNNIERLVDHSDNINVTHLEELIRTLVINKDTKMTLRQKVASVNESKVNVFEYDSESDKHNKKRKKKRKRYNSSSSDYCTEEKSSSGSGSGSDSDSGSSGSSRGSKPKSKSNSKPNPKSKSKSKSTSKSLTVHGNALYDYDDSNVVLLPNSILEIEDGHEVFSDPFVNAVQTIKGKDARRVAIYVDNGWLETNSVDYGIQKHWFTLESEEKNCTVVLTYGVYVWLRGLNVHYEELDRYWLKKKACTKEYIYFAVPEDGHFYLICLVGVNYLIHKKLQTTEGNEKNSYIIFMDSIRTDDTKNKESIAEKIYE